jgi:hypothetical protein
MISASINTSAWPPRHDKKRGKAFRYLVNLTGFVRPQDHDRLSCLTLYRVVEAVIIPRAKLSERQKF